MVAACVGLLVAVGACGGQKDKNDGVMFELSLASDIGTRLDEMGLSVTAVTVHIDEMHFRSADGRCPLPLDEVQNLSCPEDGWLRIRGPFQASMGDGAGEDDAGFWLPLPPGAYSSLALLFRAGEPGAFDGDAVSVEGLGHYAGHWSEAPLRFAFATTAASVTEIEDPLRISSETRRVTMSLAEADWFGELDFFLELCLTYPPVPFDAEGVVQVTGGSNQGCDGLVGILRQNFLAAAAKAALLVE